MKHLLKRNNEEIPAYLCDKKLNVSHSTSFNIIQQPRTMIQTKTFCFIEQRQINVDKTLHCSLAKA